MIYVSSSCVKAKYIKESVQQLVDAGFRNIELSGGTQPDENLVADLLELREKYSLNYLLHNYFPPPAIPFVVNLAAIDKDTYESTLIHLRKSIAISRELKSDKFGFHAGFMINVPTQQMGKEITKQELWDKEDCIDKFCNGYNELKFLSGKIELYIENNVLSETNYRNFNSVNPFFFTDLDSYHELAERISFQPLLDVAHLKVSCHTLGLDFSKQLEVFQNMSDYIHISDNDGLRDSNQALVKNSGLYELISRNSLKGKTITLEVYSGLEDIISTYKAVEELQK